MYAVAFVSMLQVSTVEAYELFVVLKDYLTILSGPLATEGEDMVSWNPLGRAELVTAVLEWRRLHPDVDVG